MKFLFTCGGTAGHINPALAVAGAIKAAKPDSEFLFIGAEGRMETDLVPRAGYEIRTVRITNIHRGFSAEDIKHNLNTLKNVVTSTGEAKKIIREFQPDAVVGTGGYVCYPVLKAAHALAYLRRYTSRTPSRASLPRCLRAAWTPSWSASRRAARTTSTPSAL